MKYDKENVLSVLSANTDFKTHVIDTTKKYLEATGVPTSGVLANFNFNLEQEVYTIEYTFEYESSTKTNFYIIPLSNLWA